MSYYNPYGNQGAMTSFGSYGPTSATSNIGGQGRSSSSRAYGGYGQTRGGPGSYQSQAYQPQQQGYQPYTSQQDRSYIRGGVPASGQGGGYAGNYGQNPFASRGGGGAMGLGGPGQMLGQQRQQGMQQYQQQQQAPYQAFDQRMQAMPGMQQAFSAMGLDPSTQQQMFQEYLMPQMAGLFGTGQYGMRGMMGNQNPFQGY